MNPSSYRRGLFSFGATDYAYFSDMANAWDWCVLHQYDDLNNPIMIISTSFGGGRYSGNCDSAYSLLTHAAANAMAAGMTLFLSSGNDGYCDSMGYPACLDSVISVGAVYDADIGRNPISGYVGCISYGSCVGTPDSDQVCEKLYVDLTTDADQVCTYSNTSKFMSLLAPSNWATTTKLGGGYWDTPNGFGGTSAACPYAAGAAACLQSAAKGITGSYLTQYQVKARLLRSGDLITDSKVNVTKPRVNLEASINDLEVPLFYVDPFGSCGGSTYCYTTIQAAIDAALPGVTIKIAQGTYSENLSLISSETLTLQGGWNSSFTSLSSTSSVSSMTFGSNSGAVTVEYMVVQ